MYKLHLFQLEILKKLSKEKSLRFNELLLDGLESEHMNYHLKKLLEIGYVNKSKEKYSLTDSGKDYIGRLEDNSLVVEKQPKVSVLLNIRRKNGDVIEHLLCKRLEQPYLGKVGRLTGKIRFGEQIQEAAQRELMEETGLEIDMKKIVVKQLYHKLRTDEKNSPVQDSIFFICDIDNPTGNLIETTPVQENFWISKRALEERKDIDRFDGLTLRDEDNINDPWFDESLGKAQGY